MNDTRALYSCVSELDQCFSSFVELNPHCMYEDHPALSPNCELATAMTSAICSRYFSFPILHIKSPIHTVAQTVFGCVDGYVGGIWFDHRWQVDDTREPDVYFDSWSSVRYLKHWEMSYAITTAHCTLPINHYLNGKEPNLHITQMNKYLVDLFTKDRT